MGGVNKAGLGGIDKSGVGEINIKAGVKVDGADKGYIGVADIEVGKKAGVGAVANTDNSVGGSAKVIN